MKSSSIAFLLPEEGDGTLSDELNKMKSWSYDEAASQMLTIPERYESVTGLKMSSYFGLIFYTDLIVLLRAQVNGDVIYKNVILACQRLVLHYHNVQFKETK
jgi:hypothetical protein